MSSIVKKYTVTGMGSTTFVINEFNNLANNICKWSSNFKTDTNLTFSFGIQKTTLYSINHLSICLYFGKEKDDIHFQYRVSIIDLNGTKQHTKEFQWHFIKTATMYCDRFFQSYIHNDVLIKYLVDGNLTLFCEVDVVEIDQTTIKAIQNEHNCSTLKDYKLLLESGKQSDVTFVIHGKEFQLHKAVLAARSEVFAAMFEHETKEKLENRVVLTDISVDAFEELLRYLYAGQIPEKYALELFTAADKYQLEHLKLICGQSLSSNLDIESAANTLLFADMHNAAELKSQCIAFITKNSNKVMATEGWTNLLKTRLELLVELYKDMSNSKAKNHLNDFYVTSMRCSEGVLESVPCIRHNKELMLDFVRGIFGSFVDVMCNDYNENTSRGDELAPPPKPKIPNRKQYNTFVFVLLDLVESFTNFGLSA